MAFNSGGGFNTLSGDSHLDPRTISNGSDFFLWLDAGDLTPGLVSSWPDRSGSNHSPIQSGSNRPTQIASSALIGGRPLVRFDGATSYMVGPLTAGLDQGDFELIMVHRTSLNAIPLNAILQTLIILGDPASQSNGAPMIQWENGTTANLGQLLGVKPYNLSGTSVNCNFNGNIIANKWLITTLSRVGGTNGNGGTLTLRTYGMGGNLLESVGTQDWTTASSTAFCLGLQNGTTGFFKGDIAEVIGYSRGLNDGEHQYILNYLRQKYLFQPTILEFPGLMSWYKAATGYFTNGGLTTAWNETGGFLAASNSSGALGPLRIDRDLGVYSSLLFDGATSRLLGPTSWIVAQPITIFAVVNILSWVDGACIIGGHTGTGHLRIAQAIGSDTLQMNAGSDGSYMNIPLNTWGVLCAVFNGASSTLYWNGIETTHHADTGTNDWDNIGFGSEGGTSGSLFSNYKLVECAVYQQFTDPVKIQRVTNFFRNKFGV